MSPGPRITGQRGHCGRGWLLVEECYIWYFECGVCGLCLLPVPTQQRPPGGG